METLIKNVNILNPNKEILTNYNILIEKNKIIDISKDQITTKNNVNIVDGEDNYLLPGFIDSHVHLMGNGFHKEDNMINPLALHFYNIIANGKATIDGGVTSVRDCGGADIGVKTAQEKKLFLAPKMDISIAPLMCTGGHFDLFLNSGFDMEVTYPGFPKGRCDGVEEVLKKTREVKRAGADFIKVMASGGVISTNNTPSFPQFNKKELKTIVCEAKTNNLKVTAHCHSLKGINNCIDVGISTIEHGSFIDRKTSRKMVEKDIYLVPTLVVHNTALKEGFPIWDNYANEKHSKLKEIVKVQKENVAIAYEEGVAMLMGSDCGVIKHGYNLKELEYLVEIGMSENEAIASGTIEVAKYLNKGYKVGSIEKGKIADLILVNDNPLDDISVLADSNNILKVIQDGNIVKDIQSS